MTKIRQLKCRKSSKRSDFDFNDYLDQYGTDEKNGWNWQYLEHASRCSEAERKNWKI